MSPEDDGTEVHGREFISHLVDTKDYCVFEVEGIEWHFVFNNLLDKYRDKDAPRPAPTYEEPGKFGILYSGPKIYYWVRRGSIPPDALAQAFGLPSDKVKKALFVRLQPLSRDQVAEPTVDYYGTA